MGWSLEVFFFLTEILDEACATLVSEWEATTSPRRGPTFRTCLVLRDHKARGTDKESRPHLPSQTARVSPDAHYSSATCSPRVLRSQESLDLLRKNMPHLRRLDKQRRRMEYASEFFTLSVKLVLSLVGQNPAREYTAWRSPLFR